MMMMVMMILRTVGDGDLEDDNGDDDPVFHVYIKTFGYLFISKSIEMFDSDENVNADGEINSLSIGKDSKPALSLSSNRIGKLSLGGREGGGGSSKSKTIEAHVLQKGNWLL